MKESIADIKRQLRAYGIPIGFRSGRRYICFLIFTKPDTHDPLRNLRYNHRTINGILPGRVWEVPSGGSWMQAWINLRADLALTLLLAVRKIENERKNR